MNVFHRTKKISTNSIHFIHKTDSWNIKFISLLPYSFSLRLNTVNSTNDSNCSVQNAQRTFNFCCKINVTWSVNNIYLIVFPVSSCGCRTDCNSSFLFLRHPVHCSLTVINFTDFMNFSCIIKNSFCCCSFSGINMCHNSNISHFFQRHIKTSITNYWNYN